MRGKDPLKQLPWCLTHIQNQSLPQRKRLLRLVLCSAILALMLCSCMRLVKNKRLL